MRERSCPARIVASNVSTRSRLPAQRSSRSSTPAPPIQGRHLTPACSGLAALAADARRWAAPTSHLAFIGALSFSHSSFVSSGRPDRSSRSVGLTRCSLESAGGDGRPPHPTSIASLASSPLSAGSATRPASLPRLCASHFTRERPQFSWRSPSLQAPRRFFGIPSAIRVIRLPHPPCGAPAAHSRTGHGSHVYRPPSPSRAHPGAFESPPNPGMQRTRYARR